MEINFLALLVAALSTLVVGFIWYNPKVFGSIWMRESGHTEESLKGANMAKIFILSIIYAFLMSFILQTLVIHQWGVMGLIENDLVNAKPSFAPFWEDYKNEYRTFRHGALHGFITGLFFAFPLIGNNALYERRSFKYVMVTSGFWIVCFTIMGGIICSWS